MQQMPAALTFIFWQYELRLGGYHGTASNKLVEIDLFSRNGKARSALF
jgi:hypothetical protein